MNSCRRCFSAHVRILFLHESSSADRWTCPQTRIRHTNVSQCKRGIKFPKKRSCELLRGLTICGVWFFLLLLLFKFFCNLHLIHPTIFKTVYKKKQELKITILIGVPPTPPTLPTEPHPTQSWHPFVSLLKNWILQQNYFVFAFTESLTIENVCMARDFVPKVQCGNHSTIFFQVVQYEMTKTWMLKKKEKYKHWRHSKRGSISKTS